MSGSGSVFGFEPNSGGVVATRSVPELHRLFLGLGRAVHRTVAGTGPRAGAIAQALPCALSIGFALPLALTKSRAIGARSAVGADAVCRAALGPVAGGHHPADHRGGGKMTAQGGVEGAVEAMRFGALDYLVKPFAPALLPLVMRRAPPNTSRRRKANCASSSATRSRDCARNWTRSSPPELLRYRRVIGAESVQVWADVKKKHSAHAITADGFIVGSEFKQGGHWSGAVDPKRVERFMAAHSKLS